MSEAGGSPAVMWQRLVGWPEPVQWAALAALSALIWLTYFFLLVMRWRGRGGRRFA